MRAFQPRPDSKCGGAGGSEAPWNHRASHNDITGSYAGANGCVLGTQRVKQDCTRRQRNATQKLNSPLRRLPYGYTTRALRNKPTVIPIATWTTE